MPPGDSRGQQRIRYTQCVQWQAKERAHRRRLSEPGRHTHRRNAGRVRLAKDLYYSGNCVIIDHGLGVFSYFAHLSKINVAVGDLVTPGQIVGLVGATGRVTGPHLHWTMKVSGARVGSRCRC